MKIWFFRLCCLSLLAGMAHAQGINDSPQAQPVLQAETLLEQGHPEQAYALLEPLESELAGNIQYDYLLGVSAVNSGKASRAVFALERVQATDPGYKNVGLWLSIAYYQSGDQQRAKAGFAAILAQGANGETKTKAEHYLAIIRQDEAEAAGKPSLKGKLEVGLGHDSNIVNSSPAYLTTLQLAAALPAPASNQGGMESILNLGVEGRIPVSGQYAFVAAEDDQRYYPGHSVMNSDTRVVQGGVDLARNDNTYRLDVNLRQFRQLGTGFPITGNANDYDISGVEGRARFKLSAQDYLGILLQYNQLRFLADSTQDTDQMLVGVNYTHTFQSAGAPVVYVGYTNLGDLAVRPQIAMNPAYGDGTTFASRNTDVFTLYLQYSMSKDVDVFSTGFMYFRRDTGAFARDAVVDYGKDKTSFLALGVNWRLWPRWTMRSQVGKTINSSNIALYAYSKIESTVLLRRDFN